MLIYKLTKCLSDNIFFLSNKFLLSATDSVFECCVYSDWKQLVTLCLDAIICWRSYIVLCCITSVECWCLRHFVQVKDCET